MRLRIGHALLGMVGLSCTGGVQLAANVSVGPGGGYAAMDEVPVGGGELRLVAPHVIQFDGAEREMIAFPLRHTAITARVGGMMGAYEVEQVFENPFDEPIDAVYVFPLGADGAVSGYRIGIGDRTITGEIHTRDDARKIYREAKAAGHTAAIIEQHKPNVFSQHVANIAPHETVRITISYVELLKYDDGAYELTVPLVVGPRYLPAERVGRDPIAAHAAGTTGRPDATSIPYIDKTLASSTVSFTADIDAGVPIVGITSPSHDIVSQPASPTRTRVTFGRADEIPNRDLILRYATAGPQTTVGLIAHRIDDEGYFVLTVQPKATYHTADIAPREVMIVIDNSGSMSGQPIAQAKAVASGIIDSLTERDSFNIIAFSGQVASMGPAAIPGDAGGKGRGLDYLRTMQAGGGTEMEQGVIQMLKTTPGNDRIRLVYFLTDGFVGNDDVIVTAAKNLLGTNRIFTIGIGSAPNRSLLDRLAQAGRGFASYLTLAEPAEPLAAMLVKKSAHPYLTDVQVDWGGLDVQELTPQAVPDVFAGEPLVISGKYRRPGAATIRVTATTAGRRVAIPVEVRLPDRNVFEPAASLWARRQIDQLVANRDVTDISKSVTALGLRFHLVTDYTSFVAVDRSRVVSNGQARIVEQPAVVPEGVSPETTVGTPSRRRHHDSDSGGGGHSWGFGGDEPVAWSTLAMIALGLLGAMAWLVRRRA